MTFKVSSTDIAMQPVNTTMVPDTAREARRGRYRRNRLPLLRHSTYQEGSYEGSAVTSL